MPETDAADIGPALGQAIGGRLTHTRSRTMDDMTGYGSRRGYGRPGTDNDGDGDEAPGGFAGQAANVIEHPQVDHRGHRTDAKGHCVGCGSPRCMGGCGSGCKRM